MSQNIGDMSATWGTATQFTGIKYNVIGTDSSLSTSNLIDLQVGGASRFKVQKNGQIFFELGVFSNTVALWTSYSNAINLNAASALTWSSGVPTIFSFDLALLRDAANTLAQRNGTNGQTFRLYGTYTDLTVAFERFFIEAPSTPGAAVLLGTQKGTGASARALEFQTNGATRLTIETDNTITLLGGHKFLSDANALVLTNSGGVRSFITRSDFSQIPATSQYRWGDLTSFGSDLGLARSAAGVLKVTNGSTGTGALESASVKTDAPAGGTSGTWKLGVAATISPTSPNRTIEVDIGGTIYYIAAKTTND